MTSRLLPKATDWITPTHAKLLNIALADVVPHSMHGRETNQLPLGHHLVYFPPQTHLSSLFPDGTDPIYSPGRPFTRRMWAGGTMNDLLPVEINSSLYNLTEKIVDVQVKGENDNQKIFVKIARRIFPRKKHAVTKKKAHILETRNIVFLRDKHQKSSPEAEQATAKLLMPTITPQYSCTVVPTPALLFQFSALTYNAHAIHLDKNYCQEVEGHRNMLVHGPLTVVLMLNVLKLYLSDTHKSGKNGRLVEQITSIEYKNLAPLYAEEPMTICLRRRGTEQRNTFDVWIVGRDGGYAVKGVARTTRNVDAVENEDSTESEESAWKMGDPFWQRLALRRLATGDENASKENAASVDEITAGEETNPEGTALSLAKSLVREKEILFIRRTFPRK